MYYIQHVVWLPPPHGVSRWMFHIGGMHCRAVTSYVGCCTAVHRDHGWREVSVQVWGYREGILFSLSHSSLSFSLSLPSFFPLSLLSFSTFTPLSFPPSTSSSLSLLSFSLFLLSLSPLSLSLLSLSLSPLSLSPLSLLLSFLLHSKKTKRKAKIEANHLKRDRDKARIPPLCCCCTSVLSRAVFGDWKKTNEGGVCTWKECLLKKHTPVNVYTVDLNGPCECERWESTLGLQKAYSGNVNAAIAAAIDTNNIRRS